MKERKEYIELDEAINNLKKAIEIPNDMRVKAIAAIKKSHKTQIVPTDYEHWMFDSETNEFICSNCKCGTGNVRTPPYCSQCGHPMTRD